MAEIEADHEVVYQVRLEQLPVSLFKLVFMNDKTYCSVLMTWRAFNSYQYMVYKTKPMEYVMHLKYLP